MNQTKEDELDFGKIYTQFKEMQMNQTKEDEVDFGIIQTQGRNQNLLSENQNTSTHPKTSLLCCLGLFSSGFGAAYGAASSVTGSAVLNAAGYRYNHIEATQAGATGGTLLFIMYFIYILATKSRDKNTQETQQSKSYLEEIAWTSALSALSGVLGAAIIGFRDMTPGQYALAGATGSAIIGTGLAVIDYMCRKN